MKTGSDRVDRDAAARHLEGEALGETEQTGLGRGIVRLSTLPVSPMTELMLTIRPDPRSIMCSRTAFVMQKGTEEVHVEDVAPIIVGHLRTVIERDAGIVYQEVDPAKTLHHFVDDARAVFGLIDAPWCTETAAPPPESFCCSPSAHSLSRL